MRIRIALPACAIALVLLGDVLLLTQQDRSTAVSLDAAVKGFRATDSQSSETTFTTIAPRGPSSPGSPTSAAPARGAAPTPARPSATTAAATPAPFRLPVQGVYAYRTQGHETVSMGGGRHDYPERTFATVRAKGGCDWELEHRVLEEHIERRLQCSGPGQLTEKDERVDITFFGQKNTAYYRCDPPLVLAQAGDQPGAKRTGTCRADDGQAVLTTTFVGRERLTIGGVAVDAIRVRMEGVVSGRAEGTSFSDTWAHPDTGLMLKSIRKVDTRAKAFGTTVDYREEATYELEKLEPAT
ncbi:MAG: hypothetical protein QOG87_2917 [Actinomycetota bacterium]|jgi:hypothetical protein